VPGCQNPNITRIGTPFIDKKLSRHFQALGVNPLKMEPVVGFEPTTDGLQKRKGVDTD
jgi:hypothetical protein